MVTTQTHTLNIVQHPKEGHSDPDRVIYKIVDDEGTMIAKVNGPGNLPIARDMVEAYNNKKKVVELKALLRNVLIDKLKKVQGSNLFVLGIRKTFRDGGDVDQMIASLKDQAKDNPLLMTRILDGEAVQILFNL